MRNDYRMQIAEWLREEELSLRRAALAIHAANGSVVQRHREGTNIPDRKLMRMYVIASEGRVTPNDIYGLTDLIAECLDKRSRRLARKKAAEPHPELPFADAEPARSAA